MRKPYLRKDINPSISRYSYPIISFAGFDAETKEDGLPLNYATYGYNIRMRNGVLTNGIGIEYPNFNGENFPDISYELSKVSKLFFYKHFDYNSGEKNDRVIALLGNKQVYQGFLNSERFTCINDFNFSSTNVTFLNYYHNNADYLIGISDKNEMKMYDGNVVTNANGIPNLIDACVHYGRIFGVVAKSSRIYFSAVLNPTDWSESLGAGGYITLTDEGGQIKRIINFKDALYIFREYAIHKLTAFGEQTDFNLSKVFISNNQIYTNTAAVCNDRIIFLADDGFYSFDGYVCKKILRGIFPLLADNRYSNGCYFNHKYYLASKIRADNVKVGDEDSVYPLKNNAVIIYDLDLGEVSIFRGGDIKGFLPVSLENVNRLFVYFNNTPRMYAIGQICDTGKFFNTKLHKKWQSPVTNFEKLSKDKVLKRIYLTASAPITLRAKLDNDYDFALFSSNRAQMIPVNIRADKIGLEITTDEDNFSVNGILLEFDFIRRNLDE